MSCKLDSTLFNGRPWLEQRPDPRDHRRYYRIGANGWHRRLTPSLPCLFLSSLHLHSLCFGILFAPPLIILDICASLSLFHPNLFTFYMTKESHGEDFSPHFSISRRNPHQHPYSMPRLFVFDLVFKQTSLK